MTVFHSRPVPGKRLFDLAVATVLIVVLSPVMAVVAILVRLTSRGPAVYRAPRVGLNGQMFTMYKFRSMRVDNASGSPTTALRDPRITPFGRVIRRWKLDELPQLFNVLLGDMSLVGPRPEVEECVAMYTVEQRQILAVRPGITDLASLEFIDLARVVGDTGDPLAVYLEKVFQLKNELRLDYVRRASWRLDIEILLRTLGTIASRNSGTRSG